MGWGQAQGPQLLREHAFLPVGIQKGYGQGRLVYLQGLIHPGIVQCWLLGLWLLRLAARGEEVTRTGQSYDSATVSPACPRKLPFRVVHQPVPESISRGPHERVSSCFATH